MRIYNIFVGFLYVQFWQPKCIRRNNIDLWRPWGPSASDAKGLKLSLFVDQPTISSISNDKVVNENDTATMTCTVDSIPQSIIRWIFETKELQNKYDGNLALNKIDGLSMGRYTCHAVNLLGVDNRYVDVTVKCEYLFIWKATMCNISGRWFTKHINSINIETS